MSKETQKCSPGHSQRPWKGQKKSTNSQIFRHWCNPKWYFISHQVGEEHSYSQNGQNWWRCLGFVTCAKFVNLLFWWPKTHDGCVFVHGSVFSIQSEWHRKLIRDEIYNSKLKALEQLCKRKVCCLLLLRTVWRLRTLYIFHPCTTFPSPFFHIPYSWHICCFEFAFNLK